MFIQEESGLREDLRVVFKCEGLLCGKEELDLFDVISLEKKGTYFCARSFMFTILGFSVSCEDLGYPQGPPGWDRGCLAERV